MGESAMMRRFLLVLVVVGVARAAPTVNDVVPETEPAFFADMDAAIENDEEEHMSVSDLAMKHLEEAADAEESTDYVNGHSRKAVQDAALAQTDLGGKSTVTAPKLAAHTDKVYDALVQLKAYCVATFGKTDTMDSDLSEKSASIVPFLRAFGKDPNVGTKTYKGGIISEYTRLYADEKAKYHGGLALYFLEKLNSALLEGRNLLSFKNHKWILSTSELGLQDTPSYLSKITSGVAPMMEAKNKVVENNDGADTAAALQYVTNEHNKAFKAYWKAEEAKEDAARAAYKKRIANEVTGAAYKAYSSAYAQNQKTKVLHPAVQAGAVVAKADKLEKVSKKPSISDAQMKANAEAVAAKVDKAAQAKVDSLPKLITVLEEQNTQAIVDADAKVKAIEEEKNIAISQKESAAKKAAKKATLAPTPA